MNRFIVKIILIVAVVIFSWGCENDYPDSIYNSEQSFKPNPVITSISPESAFAGVDTLDIIGQNFSENAKDMSIFFNGQEGEIVFASPTLIQAVPANIIGDSIKIQLWVDDALEFASFDSYTLESVVIDYGLFDQFDNIYGIEVDLAEKVYVSLLGKLIQTVNQDLERNEYVSNLLTDKTTQILWGPEGEIYYLNGIRFLVKLEPNAGSSGLYQTLPGNAWDLDFDENLNIYAGGAGEAIYKVTPEPDKSVSTVADYAGVNIKAIRVYNNYVYVAGKGPDGSKLWRNEIIDGSETLGDNEEVYSLEADHPGFEILSLEISEDGEFYIGTTAAEGLYVVSSNGSSKPMYPGILKPDIYAVTWGNGQFLYCTTKEIIEKDDGSEAEVSNLIRVNARKNGAPHYGRQ